MLSGSKGERILETTRGKVLALLRLGPRTADELAAALALTDNAVRAHLATLERDRLVQSAGERREGKVGKPATLYQIAPDVDELFSRAYLPLLGSLLTMLGERLKPRQLRAFLRAVGRRLATGLEQPSGDLARRVGAASTLLNQLGGLSSVEELQAGKHYTIQSRGCPVSAAVRTRPEVCEAMVALVSELTGGRVRSCCERGERPSCCFEVRSEEA